MPASQRFCTSSYMVRTHIKSKVSLVLCLPESPFSSFCKSSPCCQPLIWGSKATREWSCYFCDFSLILGLWWLSIFLSRSSEAVFTGLLCSFVLWSKAWAGTCCRRDANGLGRSSGTQTLELEVARHDLTITLFTFNSDDNSEFWW